MRASAQSPACLAAAMLAFASAASALAGVAECLNVRAPQLAQLASCGHSGSIEYCLANRLPKESHLCTVDILAACFVDAGCQPAEAQIEAAWTLKRCEREAASNGNGNGNGNGNVVEELRRRMPAPTQAPEARAAAPVEARDSTFQDTETATLQCLTTKTVSTTMCPIQTTGPNAGKTTLSCFSTIATFPTCAAGLLCATDSIGVTTCMEKQDQLDASGYVITAIFGGGILVAISTLCFFCCRERRQDKRLTKAAEAAAIARQAAVDSKRAGAAVRNVTGTGGQMQTDSQPLMPSSMAQSSHQYQEPYQEPHQQPPQMLPSLQLNDNSGDIAGPNPFADQRGLR